MSSIGRAGDISHTHTHTHTPFQIIEAIDVGVQENEIEPSTATTKHASAVNRAEQRCGRFDRKGAKTTCNYPDV